ncbi:MAG: CDP-alcohol phosphatidyltransferase family protein [Anaerolineae bacterium]
MVTAKTLADTLTGLRVLIGAWLIWLGVTAGPEAAGLACLGLLLAWASDLLDGPLARRDPRQIRTWIGDHDLAVDVWASFGVWVYLAAAHFIATTIAVVYVVVVAIGLWRSHSVHLAWAVQAVPYAAMIRVGVQYAPPYGLALIIWVLTTVIVTWPRFPRETVPQFLAGMRALLRGDDTE